ncbi:MAG: hypothetical protein SGPRY_013766 [Prymnesium sp.]
MPFSFSPHSLLTTATPSQLLILPERQPVFVHCLDGVSVTGTILMCMRKLQRWPPPSYHAEFQRFASQGSEVFSSHRVSLRALAKHSPQCSRAENATGHTLAGPAAHICQFVESFKPEIVTAELSHSKPMECVDAQ